MADELTTLQQEVAALTRQRDTLREQVANLKLGLDREGKRWTCVMALVANYWAHNTQIELRQVVQKASMLSDMIWDEVMADREKHL